MTALTIPPFWILEDTNGHLRRETRLDSNEPVPDQIDLRLYRVEKSVPKLVQTRSYEPGTLSKLGIERSGLAVELLEAAGIEEGIVVCSHRMTSARSTVLALADAGLDFVIEISPRTAVDFRQAGSPCNLLTPQAKLRSAVWNKVDAGAPGSGAAYSATELGRVDFGSVEELRCFALSNGGISDFTRGTLVGVSSLPDEISLETLAHLLGWIRWIRPAVRREERRNGSPAPAVTSEVPKSDDQLLLNLPVRANLQSAKRLDEEAAVERDTELFRDAEFRGHLVAAGRPLNVVELFAGAGGMGLGFLLANGVGPTRFRILYSGELHPVYANTLRQNHRYLREQKLVHEDAVPAAVEPQDLCLREARDKIGAIAQDGEGVDILVGGPPCQGFSSANRNSWSSSNPNNRLVDTFLDYVERLKPRVLLMENVQGILWTPRHGSEQTGLSVAEHVVRRLAKAGYVFFAKLLDAAWYGVPQHRNRFFLLGIHQDLGYGREDFGRWGSFPLPTHGPGTDSSPVTVRSAIADLPTVANGYSATETKYEGIADASNWFLNLMRCGAEAGVVTDHIVSKQAAYVVERYSRIPEGGNWQDIIDLMTNYAAVERTHSNIYRRLKWDDPSITIGHYRKSMIIHPSQDRGLSLREAARLQSFPDWFRFAGGPDTLGGGLTHKQQQLANAVCPLVTKAVASFVLKL